MKDLQINNINLKFERDLNKFLPIHEKNKKNPYLVIDRDFYEKYMHEFEIVYDVYIKSLKEIYFELSKDNITDFRYATLKALEGNIIKCIDSIENLICECHIMIIFKMFPETSPYKKLHL